MDLEKQDLDMQFGGSNTILVAIWMVTYNQEAHIQQAIESVMIQKTNFVYKLFVGEDCSSDNTREICKKLKDKYPNKIEIFLNDENLGANKNARQIYQQCFDSGAKYIALLEGDDYWTDSFKLQKQVDFLEKNGDHNICFHRSYQLKDSSLVMHDVPSPFEKTSFYYIELLRHFNFMLTASVVFRSPNLNIFPQWFITMPFGDMALYKIVSQDKKIGCINEIMSVYRIHENGVWSVLKPIEGIRQYLDFYKKIYFYLSQEEKTIVSDKIKKNLAQVSKLKYPKSAIMNKGYYYYQLMKFDKYI